VSRSKSRRSAVLRRRFLLRLAAAQDELCFHCDKPMDLPEAKSYYENDSRNDPNVASLDHLVPKSKNGRRGFNVVIAHRRCNELRGNADPTPEQIAKLDALNIKRLHLFTEEMGKTSPATFGIITNASVVLAHILDHYEGDKPHHLRHRICSLFQKFNFDMNAIDLVSNRNTWNKCKNALVAQYLKEASRIEFEGSTHVHSVFLGITRDREERLWPKEAALQKIMGHHSRGRRRKLRRELNYRLAQIALAAREEPICR
jgi:hypothetical protein